MGLGLALVPLMVIAAANLSGSAPAKAEIVVPMKVSAFVPIAFDKLKPTAYDDDGGTIRTTVKSSSSFLLKAFDKVEKVKEMTFEWKSQGDLAVKNATIQKSKDGDDARLRVGLILAGDPPMMPFMAPDWVKTIREKLYFPAGRLKFVLAGSPVPAASVWTSPYNDAITLIAAEDQALPQGWHQGHAKFAKTQKVVGLWIMADGDNTKSSFVTWLRKLVLR